MRFSSYLTAVGFGRTAFVALLYFTGPLRASLPPAGSDGGIALTEDSMHRLGAADFGFSDPDEPSPDAFRGLYIKSLPAQGTLALDGVPAQVGDFVSLNPVPGLRWTDRGVSGFWRSLASSADGTRLIAAEYDSDLGTRLYLSADSGATWTPRESNRIWFAVTSSADGTRLAAAVIQGQIYVSSDSGVTWVARGPSQTWISLASSEDGRKLVAAASGGRLYTSADFGTTWTAREASRSWVSVASSADGTRLAAAVSDGGSLYTSTDSGVTWKVRQSGGNWQSVASSADGLRLVALDRGSPLGNGIQTSADGGLTWTPHPVARWWTGLASSADGSRLVAAADQLYFSQDFGETWRPRESSHAWSAVASSADGGKLVAAVNYGSLYTSVESLPALTFTPAADAFGAPYADFTFQVADSGAPGANLDPTPNRLTFSVAPVEDAPRLALALALPDQAAPTGLLFEYRLAEGSFVDPDPGSVLTYAAGRADGAALPGWLSFDAGTRTFRGTPLAAESVEIKVTATDNSAAALSGSGTFRLQVSGLPSGTDGAVGLTEEGSYTFKAADFGFSDPLELVAQRFTGIRLSSLPDLGTLTLESNAVAVGDRVSILPFPGVSWIPQTSLQGAYALASSADGLKLLALSGGQVAMSSNSGVSWVPRGVYRQYSAVASSSDGSRLVAVVDDGQIYTSQDSGSSWVAREQVRNWSGVASSADGSKLVACDRGAWAGRLYTSADYGVTWRPRDDFRHWSAVTSSADGTRLAAVTNFPAYPYYSDYVYTSTDSGMTWTPRGGPGSYRAIASSADGLRLVTVQNGRISRSADGGATWKYYDGPYYWKAVASSADGLRLVAAEDSGGRIHVSSDGGATWIQREMRRNWQAVASSADGQKLWAGAEAAPLYLSVPSAPRLLYTPPPDGTGTPYSAFRFQVEDSGPAGANRDPAPKLMALNVANLNDAPTAGPAPGPQTALKGVPFAFELPTETFADIDPGNVFRYEAKQLDGRALPGWLAFDPQTGRFSGLPGPADTGAVNLLVTATDNGTPPASATNGFRLTVSGDPPVGTDGSAVIDEDGTYAFSAADFGFADSGESPANRFSQVKLQSVPASGSLKVDGVALSAGEWIRMVPDARMVWTARDSSRAWSSLASSADGVKLAAVARFDAMGQIYTSGNSGETWTARGAARNWYQIASSADGSKLVASELAGPLFTSTDFGVTWVERSSGLRDWNSLASSADGSRLAGVARDTFGKIYLSANSGVTWTASAPERSWQSVACSADGTRILASAYGSQLYTSIDSGLTWTARETARGWGAVASSADGWKLVAAVQGGQIYTSSDGGSTWIARDSARNWNAVVSSADGLRLAASVYLGRIYTSIDAGVTWTPCESARSWSDLATSADGLKLTAAADIGKLYTSTAALPQLVFQPAAHGFGQPYASFGFQVADDGVEGSTLALVPNTFTLFVNSVNDAPVAFGALPDRSARENSPFTATFAANSFTDADDGTILTYTASLADGSPLPAWLAFSPATRTFSGTPGVRDTGSFAIKVTASDQGQPPLSASSNFLMVVNNVDGPPVGAGGSATLTADSTYQFKAADFGFSDPGDFPPNAFTRVKVSTLPVAGSLSIDGVPAAAGSFASLVPSPAGSTWIPRATAQNWYAIASSADGMILGAVANNGRIYISADAGVTWTARESNRAWYSIASSADGRRMAAVVQGGQIYTSSDTGATWTAREISRNWRTIASSSDGLRLAAIVNNGQIYTSADAGTTWTARETVRAWYSIASSADGLKLIAAVQNGLLYTSLDAGATWTPRDSSRNWRTVVSSADGAKLVAGVNGGQIYLSSDSGLNWTAREANRSWYSLCTSADGSRLGAVVSSGQIYISTDAGATWRPRDAVRDWRAITSSADGNRLAAIVPDVRVFTSSPGPAQTLTYIPATGGLGTPYASFTYQVEDDGSPAANLDLTPRTFTLNVAAASPFAQWAALHGLPSDPLADGGAHLLDFAFGLDPAGSERCEFAFGPDGISQRGLPSLSVLDSAGAAIFRAQFGRRKGSGLLYRVEFSADLTQWQPAGVEPAVLADDGLVEACQVPFPALLKEGRRPQYFRVSVKMP